MNYTIEISRRIYNATAAELARLRRLYPNSQDVQARVRRALADRQKNGL
jgi:hypothetical protein